MTTTTAIRTVTVFIVTTLIGDPYTAAAIAADDSQAVPAAMWRCHIGDSIDWDSVSAAVRDTPSPSADSCDDPLAAAPAIRAAAAEIGIAPDEAADLARCCACRDEAALGLQTIEVECEDQATAHTLETIFDGRHLGRDEIIHLIDSIADGSTAIV